MGIDPESSGVITQGQIKRLYTIATSHHWTHAGVLRLIEANFGVRSTTELTKAQYDAVCEHMESSILPDNVTLRCRNTNDLFNG
jgi:hypothetical protein